MARGAQWKAQAGLAACVVQIPVQCGTAVPAAGTVAACMAVTHRIEVRDLNDAGPIAMEAVA